MFKSTLFPETGAGMYKYNILTHWSGHLGLFVRKIDIGALQSAELSVNGVPISTVAFSANNLERFFKAGDLASPIELDFIKFISGAIPPRVAIVRVFMSKPLDTALLEVEVPRTNTGAAGVVETLKDKTRYEITNSNTRRLF